MYLLVKIPLNGKEIYLDFINWDYHNCVDFARHNSQTVCFERNNVTLISVASNKATFNGLYSEVINQRESLCDLHTFNMENNKFAFQLSNSLYIENMQLKYFYAANNKFSVEKEFQFCKLMPEVEVVDASGNFIAIDNAIPVALVKDCQKLKRLDLAGNNISVLKDLDLNGTEQLHFLNLSHNNLRDFIGVLRQLGMDYVTRNHGIEIDLTDNPFECSCKTINHFKAFSRICTKNNITLINLHQYKCINISALIYDDDYNARQINKCPNVIFFIGVGSALGAFLTFIFVLSITCIFICKKRWYIKYALFKLKQYM